MRTNLRAAARPHRRSSRPAKRKLAGNARERAPYEEFRGDPIRVADRAAARRRSSEMPGLLKLSIVYFAGVAAFEALRRISRTVASRSIR